MNSVLHQLLERRLLDIGEDDSRLEKLQQASAALAAALKAEPSLAVPFALIGADASTPGDDATFALANRALMDVWPTYRNKYQDAPTEIWRALLLDALATRGADNADVATAAALTLASVLPRVPLGRDRDVVVGVYSALRQTAEERAVQDWNNEVPAVKFRVQKPKLGTDRTTEVVELDRDRLEKLWVYASGPHGEDGKPAFKDPNPYWTNSAPNWSYQFAPRAALAVGEVVDAALADVAKAAAAATEGTQAQLRQWAEKTGDLLRQTVATVARGAAGVQRRSALLWWRAALFSPSSRQSYRDLPLATAALQMAVDLHAQVPAHAPESVEHFLREAVRDLVRRAGADARATGMSMSLEDAISAVTAVVGLPPAAGEASHGRAPLLDLVLVAALGTTPTHDAIAARLGPAAEGAVAVDELAAWLFRDLQARVVATVEEPADDQDDEAA